MATLLIILSLLLWVLSSPYTTATGKSGHHTAKIRSITSIFFFPTLLYPSLEDIVSLCATEPTLCSLLLKQKYRTAGVRQSFGCQNSTQHTRPCLGPERWQHKARGDRALPVPGWLCCSQHWHRKHALKKKMQLCHCCVHTFYLSTLKNLSNFQENVSSIVISI